MAYLQPRVVRQRHVPQLVTGLAGRGVPPGARRVPRRPPPPLPGDRRGVRGRGRRRREQVDRPAVRPAPHRRPRPPGHQPGPRLPRGRPLLEQVRRSASPSRADGDRHGHLPAAPAGRAVGRPAAGVGRPRRGRAARRPRALRGPRRPAPPHAASGRCTTSACRRRTGRSTTWASAACTLGPSHGVAGSRTRFTDGPHRAAVSTTRGDRRCRPRPAPGRHRRDPAPAAGLRVRRARARAPARVA